MEEFIALLLARMTEIGVFTEDQDALVQAIRVGSGAAAAIQRLVGALTDAQWERVSREMGQLMRTSILTMNDKECAIFDQVLGAQALQAHPPTMADAVDRMHTSTDPSAPLRAFLHGLNEVRRDALIAKMTRPQADLYRAFEEAQSLASLKAFVDSIDSFEELMRLMAALEESEQGLFMMAINEVVPSEVPAAMAPAGAPEAGA